MDYDAIVRTATEVLHRGAPMDVGTLLGLLVGGLEAAIAILLAVSVVKLATAAYGLTAPHDAEAVPLLHVLALAAGVVTGIALLINVPHLDAFRPWRLFNYEGPWRLGILGFLADYALPSGRTFANAIAALGEPGPAAVVSWLAVLLLAAGPAIALGWWRDRRSRLRAVAAFLLLMLSTAMLIHYAAHLLAWTAAQLNFWLFAVALFLWQRYRYAPPSTGHGH